MQILGNNKKVETEYVWLDKDTAEGFGGEAGKGGWFIADDDVGFIFPDPTVTLANGDSVQLLLPSGATINNAGQVSDADVLYTARKDYNYVGNPFPSLNDIQNIQLADAVGSTDAYMQFLGNNKKVETEYVWLDKDTAEGFGGEAGKGGWFIADDDVGFIFPDPAVNLNPGEAVQIQLPGISTVTVLSPIEL